MHSSSRAGPAARWIAPQTPPPASRDSFAAFTIASTPSLVISPRITRMRSSMPASLQLLAELLRVEVDDHNRHAPLDEGVVLEFHPAAAAEDDAAGGVDHPRRRDCLGQVPEERRHRVERE